MDYNFIDKIYKTIITERKWIYTTNIGNEKIKHNKSIIIRKKRAINMFNNGLFSYSKYEYDNNARIVKEIKEPCAYCNLIKIDSSEFKFLNKKN